MDDVRDVQKNVTRNLKYLQKINDIKTQKELAEKMDISPSALTKIMSEAQIPGPHFLIQIKKNFQCSIDDFMFTDMEETVNQKSEVREILSSEKSDKFLGVYQMYYFDTSAYKGRERNGDAKALKSGVLIVHKDAKREECFQAIALFNLKKDEADDCYKKCDQMLENSGFSQMKHYLKNYDAEHYLYEGTMEFSAKYVYLSMEFGNKDKMLTILYNPDGSNTKNYIGGLGAMVSVSKGRNASPCVQYLGISKYSLLCSREEIAAHLLMHYPNVKTYDSIDNLMAMITKFYDSEEDRDYLNSDEKKIMIRYHIDKVINETIERNLFRTVIVSGQDDDDFYHFIKRVNHIS